MINEILTLLPYLFLAISMNIILGVYYNVESIKEKFNKKKLIKGVVKSFIISYGFISSGIIYDKLFEVVELGGIEIQPDLLIKSAIILYLAKGLTNLKDILKVGEIYGEKEEKEEIEVIEYEV